MSLYAKSWLFTAWVFVLMFTFPNWHIFLRSHFGSAGTPIAVVFWLSHGLAMLYVFVCPACGFSLFTSKGSFFTSRHPLAEQEMFWLRPGSLRQRVRSSEQHMRLVGQHHFWLPWIFQGAGIRA